MLFQFFIEPGSIPFLSQGRDSREAKNRAVLFLEYFNIPTDTLRLKKFVRTKGQMLIQCFIEYGSPFFLTQGKNFINGRENAKVFLEHWAMPTDTLHLKRFKRTKRKVKKSTHGTTSGK